MKIRSGYPFYGQSIGVLVFSSQSPRVPGDAGHAGSFSYPVRFQVVDGCFMDMVEGSDAVREKLIEACRQLKAQGVRGVVADCGLISLYQDVLGAEMPFVGASLCQIPTVWQMIGRTGTIGVITGHSDLLKKTHLRNSGWDESIPLTIQGMQCLEHFAQVVIHGNPALDVEKMRRDVVQAACLLRESTPDLRAVILECSNLATYSRDVAEALNLPVFDTVSAANLLQYALEPPRYV